MFEPEAHAENIVSSEELGNDLFLKREHRRILQIRIVSILTIIAYMGGLYGDYVSLYQIGGFPVMFFARFAAFLAALLCIASTFTARYTRFISISGLLYLMVICTSECIELIIKPDLGVQYLPFITFVVITYYLFFPIHQVFQITGAVIVSIGYLLVALVFMDYESGVIVAMVIELILVNALGIYHVRAISSARIRETQAILDLAQLNEYLQIEISERKKAQSRLIEQATIDELTQVYNRRQFFHLAQREIERSRRTGVPFGLLFLDVDHFKRINDTYGHDVGDTVLIRLAEICMHDIRTMDIFGRYGGEEFALIAPDCSCELAVKVADRLRTRIAGSEFTTESGSLHITVSIGVAAFTGDESQDIDQIVKRADQALYEAKRSGRNRVIAWQEAT